ncbi:hypothetical protein BHM03_00008024 [Ensete ventricosum]|nr:hypothetical protein BHM03_00008024 [Ensete ventricosum]
MCLPGCSCLDVRLEMLLLGGSRGVLHEDLVGVGARPTEPPSAIPKGDFYTCGPGDSRTGFLNAGGVLDWLGHTAPRWSLSLLVPGASVGGSSVRSAMLCQVPMWPTGAEVSEKS